MRIEGWLIYSTLDDSLINKVYLKHDEAVEQRKSFASKNQMPNESWEDAINRWNILEASVDYKIPRKAKKL